MFGITIPTEWKFSFGFLVAVTLLALLSKTATVSLSGTNETTRKHIKRLVKQAQHWQGVADSSANQLVQLLYTSKALAQAKIARQLAPEPEVNKLIGIDISELVYDLEAIESKRMGHLSTKYPEFQIGSAILP